MYTKKSIGILLGSIALATVFVVGVSSARASFLGDFLRGVSSFFVSRGTSTTSQSSPPVVSSLYKPALDYERAVVEAVKRAEPAVVSIVISKNVPILENCPGNPFGDLPPEFQHFFGGDQFFTSCEKGTQLQDVGGGSGFIISADGLIVTNKHVVSDSQSSYTVFTNDGKKYSAKVLAQDPVQDLAIVKISAQGLSTVVLGDSDAVELGQTAIAIGNALGEFRNTVSVGVISGLSRTVTASGVGLEETISGVLQTDAAINLGNSGGPLLNLRGEVIGIDTAVASGAQNIGFALPINAVKRAIASVRATGTIQTPFLGVRYTAVTPEFAKKQRLPVDYGALVRGSGEGPGVIPQSPAEKAGIVVEDIILQVDDQKIDSGHPLGLLIAQHSVGDEIKLTVRRGSQTLTLSVILAKRPGE